MCYFCTAALEEYRPSDIKVIWTQFRNPSKRVYSRIKPNACAKLFIDHKHNRLMVHPKNDRSKEFWTYIDKDYINNLTQSDTDRRYSKRFSCLCCVE